MEEHAVRGYERKRVRTLLHGKEASPGKDLDGVADEQEQPDCDEEAGSAVRERQRGADELACCQNGDRNGEHTRADGEGTLCRSANELQGPPPTRGRCR